MGVPKFKKGVAFIDGKGKNTQTGSNNIESLEHMLSEQAKCDPCGCDNCKCYETICAANTGELLIRYYTVTGQGAITEVIEPFDVGIVNVNAYYDAR